MSEAVARAEYELASYVGVLQSVLAGAAEDSIPHSFWEVGGSQADTEMPNHETPDTLLQRVEWETAIETQRINGLVDSTVAPQLRSLRAAVVQLGGGVDANGQVLDLPVEVLEKEVAVLAARSAELGKRMVELYDEAAALAATLEAEVMEKKIPTL